MSDQPPSQPPGPPQQPYQPPAGPPISPQFGVPPMRPVDMPPDEVEARRRRMRMGMIGAGVGLGVNILIVAISVGLGVTADTSGSDQWIGMQLVLFAGLLLAAPIQVIVGIVLAAVPGTRPFGVGFLIGSAVGIIIMAGACFAPLLAQPTY